MLRALKPKNHWPWLILFLAGCASVGITQYDPWDERYGLDSPKNRIVAADTKNGQYYRNEVAPILEQRCVVCHGCYDAPCQLKLSSPEGIDRGASKDVVYDGARLLASDPTRLGIDASSTFEWRQKGFHSVLNERTQLPKTNLQASLLYKFIEHKQQQPVVTNKHLGPEVTIGLDHKAQCPAPHEANEYLNNNPSHGMPYGLPALTSEEFATLTEWVSNGGIMSNKAPLNKRYIQQIEKWETFLNQDDLKHQLMARYVYEHIYLAHLYFSELDKGKPSNKKTYFRIIRSATPPGQAIDPIKTRRPYDDPGVQRVYYRLKQEQETLLDKTHMPYRLDQKRMDWINDLFIKPEYQVAEFPSYEPEVAANPFEAFKAIPGRSKYRFMLEESQFTIMGFIKGPVCRGQIALNVIDDHFWVAFLDPDVEPQKMDAFIEEQRHNLVLPGEKESNADILTTWLSMSVNHNEYLDHKLALKNRLSDQNKLNLDLVWDGDTHNDNASLTIFRHFDSSTVLKGWVGQQPKTLWLIDYPLLERIHYLLVAEYDVFGNIGHQMNTRLYMDFLRMEGEGNLLSLLPAKDRKSLWQHWYRNSHQQVKEYVFGPKVNFEVPSNVKYETEDSKSELIDKIKVKLNGLANSSHNLGSDSLDTTLQALHKAPSGAPTIMPEMGILSVETAQGLSLYTILRNSGHSNIDTLLFEDNNRLPEEDYLTVNKGITGSYPAAFWHVKEAEIHKFVKSVHNLESENDYAQLMDDFGVRRTALDFWQHSDRIHQHYQNQQPYTAGLLDYNRLENR